MRILHLATFQKGGATIAAMRLHETLIANGFDSKFLFLKGKGESNTIFLYKKKNFLIDLTLKISDRLGIPLSWQQRNNFKTQSNKRPFELFSFAATPFKKLHEHPLVKNADIINLHWVANFVDHSTFFKNVKQPIIWTLHDMNPFQGGFHYKEDEIRFAKSLNGLDDEQYAIKKQALSKKDPHSLNIVAPSKWLLDLSIQSEILGRFPHNHVPYGIDTGIFKMQNKAESKQKLGLPMDKIVVLFVAEILHIRRKGLDMVMNLIKDESIRSRCIFLAVGKIKRAHQIPEIKYLGTISDEKDMSVAYNAADIFILPSREDNLPNTMIESLCCGTPVVGYSIGGLKDTIVNHKNGLLAKNITQQELKDAFIACINDNHTFNRVEISSHAHACYANEIQLKTYLNIYEKCLAS